MLASDPLQWDDLMRARKTLMMSWMVEPVSLSLYVTSSLATVANQRHGMPSAGEGELDLIADSTIRLAKGPIYSPGVARYACYRFSIYVKKLP